MEQSVITTDTLAVIVAKAEATVERELTAMEKLFVEFAVEQIRLGLV